MLAVTHTIVIARLKHDPLGIIRTSPTEEHRCLAILSNILKARMPLGSERRQETLQSLVAPCLHLTLGSIFRRFLAIISPMPCERSFQRRPGSPKPNGSLLEELLFEPETYPDGVAESFPKAFGSGRGFHTGKPAGG